MKKTNVALTILMALGLAACGSSSSSSENKSVETKSVVSTQTEVGKGKTSSGTAQSSGASTNGSTQTNGNTSSSNNTGNSNQNGGDTSSSNNTGNSTKNDDKKDELPQEKTPYTANYPSVGSGYVIPKNEGNIQEASVTSGAAQLTSVIDIEGKTIPISYSNINSNSIYLDSQDKKLYAEKGENTQIVFIAQNDLENQYLFTSGTNLSKTMPTAGEVTYKGQSFNIYSSEGTGTLNTIAKGTSEFVADFNQKILTGTVKSSLENSTFKPVEISANITQNTFSGSKNYISVQGGFFGENASELIGDYRTEKGSPQDAIGVFRASKSE